MKISKLLNKKNYLFFLLFIFFSISSANEPVDIWNIDKSKIETEQDNQNETEVSNEISEQAISVYDLNNQKNNNNQNLILQETNIEDKISLYGLYDPDENNLSIEMWKESEGEEIKKIFDKVILLNLSKDALDLLEIALLTNSNAPNINITRKEFYNFQKNFLIKKNDLNLIKLFLEKNPDFFLKDDLVNYYSNYYLAESNIEKSCEIFDSIGEALLTNDYTSKLKIYCLVNSNEIEKALLIYDLKKEMGLKDDFFEKKIFKLIGFETENDTKISDKNLLELHLSHRSVENFEYNPNENTSKDIWKYLASANLLEKVENIDLEDIEKINLIEKAAHDGNYNENDLFKLYTRYQFNFNQLLSAKENYKTLDKSSQRALIYQKMLLTNEVSDKLYLARLLKKLFEADDLGNAFYAELSKTLLTIDESRVTPDFTSFYENNIIDEETAIRKIKFNNKIIHQSKLLNYFVDNKDISKVEKETNDLLKNILKDKKYIITTNDEILLESLKYDGIKILKKYTDRYSPNVNIPPDIQAKINNRDLGLVLLRIVEIIGEDHLQDLGSETLNFIVITLNQLDLDQIRNKIILKTLPIRI
tara:strand:+ start:178 stop:1947 length:1770 start_codon:yes stop_codon:yes gene_type:complete